MGIKYDYLNGSTGWRDHQLALRYHKLGSKLRLWLDYAWRWCSQLRTPLSFPSVAPIYRRRNNRPKPFDYTGYLEAVLTHTSN